MVFYKVLFFSSYVIRTCPGDWNCWFRSQMQIHLQRTIEEATTACGGDFVEVLCLIVTDTLSKKETTSSHDARMIRHLGFRVCTCKIQHQLLMSKITTCILSMNLPWWNFWKKLSKASNTWTAAALGSSGMIITSRYQILVYQRHTPQACGWMQRNYNERNEFSSRNPLV